MRVSRGRCLFVRQTSAALSLSAMELALAFTLETCVADCHKYKYQLLINLEHLVAIHHLFQFGYINYILY